MILEVLSILEHVQFGLDELVTCILHTLSVKFQGVENQVQDMCNATADFEFEVT